MTGSRWTKLTTYLCLTRRHFRPAIFDSILREVRHLWIQNSQCPSICRPVMRVWWQPTKWRLQWPLSASVSTVSEMDSLWLGICGIVKNIWKDYIQYKWRRWAKITHYNDYNHSSVNDEENYLLHSLWLFRLLVQFNFHLLLLLEKLDII